MRRATRRFAVPAVVLAAACGDPPPPDPGALPVTALLADPDTAGYRRVTEARPFSFPEDHGPHPGYRHEWWYFTGNLAGDGREYGFQLTFFRSALRPGAPSVRTGWATSQAYMAHFAVTDVAAGRFHAFERFQRGALDLAGARGDPLRVWLGDWEAQAAGSSLRYDAPLA